MEFFAPGDRVVAINTNISAPIYLEDDGRQRPFLFPDGPLRQGVIYHVVETLAHPCGRQGIYLTGLRVLWGTEEIPWDFSRFRKVDTLRNHAPKKRRKKQPAVLVGG